ncbi:MAG TPA: hypothetical protein VD927_17725 [Chryseosolibacter sp.]|nr:hypothetical protein [Chryseosolibacter sp.]
MALRNVAAWAALQGTKAVRYPRILLLQLGSRPMSATAPLLRQPLDTSVLPLLSLLRQNFSNHKS